MCIEELVLPFLLVSHSASSKWLVYEASASVPSAPDPPSLVEAAVTSISLTWKEPEVATSTVHVHWNIIAHVHCTCIVPS